MIRTWKALSRSDWPEWVVKALNNDTLRSAWEGNQQLTLRGKTFLYRVTPRNRKPRPLVHLQD